MAETSDFCYDLFVVHADTDADRAWVDGYLIHALGVEPDRLILPRTFALGATIPAEFDRAISSSRYTLLVLSPAFLADRWAEFGQDLVTFTSVEEGRSRMVVLTLHPCQLPLRLRFRVRLDCTDPTQWEPEVGRLRDLLERAEPVPERIACPYPGMVPFDAQQACYFYGREDEIQWMLRHFRDQHFLLVIGASGSGKSSLIRAGLLPRLGATSLFPPGFWAVQSMRPGDRPTHALAEALGGGAEPIGPALDALLAARPPARRLLLVIDQFEEVFTQVADRDERARFIRAVKAVGASENAAVLLAMRADFFPDLMESDLWPVEPGRRLELARLRGASLQQAIERPASDVGVYLEAGLARQIVSDSADEPGALPLVQEAMVLLWDRMRRRLIPLSEYQDLGGDGRSGLAVAIATKADAVLARLADLSPQAQAIARRVFLRLIQFGEGRADTRRQQPLAALRAAGDDPLLFDRTLRALVDNRLLTLGGEEEKDASVDVAHEALIVGWPALRDWVRSRRETELTRRRLEAKAAEWCRLGSGGRGLLDEIELLEAERLLDGPDAPDLGPSPELIGLVRSSRAALLEAEREKKAIRARELQQARDLSEARRRRAVIFRRALIVSAIALTVAVGAALFGWREFRREEAARADVEHQLRLANSRRLAGLALANLDESPIDLALLLGVAAYRTYDTFEARNCLFSALETSPDLRACFYLRPGRVRLAFESVDMARVDSLAFSPDGRTLASLGSAEKSITPGVDALETIILWDLGQRRRVGRLATVPGEFLRGLVFSPTGDLLAACDPSAGTIALWDVPARRRLPRLPGEYGVNHLAFSADGRFLASDTHGGTILLWDTSSRQVVARLAPEKPVSPTCLAFSRDSRRIAAGHEHGIILWDLDTRKPAEPAIAIRDGAPTVVCFSRDGKSLFYLTKTGPVYRVLLSAGRNAGSRFSVTPPKTDELFKTRKIIYNNVSSSFGGAGFTEGSLDRGSDGRVRATRRFGDLFVQWEANWPGVGKVLAGHRGNLCNLAVGPDGRTVASGSGEGMIVLWDAGQRPRLSGHKKGAAALAFSPDGRTLASSGDWDKSIILWDIASRRRGADLPLEPSELARTLAFAPDGKTLASAGSVAGDDNIVFWEVAARRRVGQIKTGDRRTVEQLSYSPDGRTLTSGTEFSFDVWDVASRRRITGSGGPRAGNPPPTSIVGVMAFSRDGKTLAVATADNAIVLWDVASGKSPVPKLTGHGYRVIALAFSPDGKTLASTGLDLKLFLWDVPTGHRLPRYPVADPSGGNLLLFSPDSKTLAVGHLDQTLSLWDVGEGRQIGPLIGGYSPGSFACMAFSPDGKTLAFSGEDQTIPLVDLDPQSWCDRAVRIANRNLSPAEWDRFVGKDVPYRKWLPDFPSDDADSQEAPAAPR
jgi:WD40 repeat protein